MTLVVLTDQERETIRAALWDQVKQWGWRDAEDLLPKITATKQLCAYIPDSEETA